MISWSHDDCFIVVAKSPLLMNRYDRTPGSPSTDEMCVGTECKNSLPNAIHDIIGKTVHIWRWNTEVFWYLSNKSKPRNITAEVSISACRAVGILKELLV